ncbi:hypothetical protein TNCV_2086911 [Trichonephila clavipes]|nr:hypothetical protein TNCV_2086911 [Trichonephila clavipes]
MVKMIGSWLACQEFEPSISEDPSHWGSLRVISFESSKVIRLVVFRKGEFRLRCRSRHSSMVQNDEVRGQKPSSR